MNLPPELVDEIIFNLASDVQSLHSCSLVAKSWTLPSRKWLFKDVIIPESPTNDGWIGSRRGTLSYCATFGPSRTRSTSVCGTPRLRHITSILSSITYPRSAVSDTWDCLPHSSDLISLKRSDSFLLFGTSSHHYASLAAVLHRPPSSPSSTTSPSSQISASRLLRTRRTVYLPPSFLDPYVADLPSPSAGPNI